MVAHRRGLSCLYKCTISNKSEDATTKQAKLSAEKRKRFFQIPNAKDIPVKQELAMKLLRNICNDRIQIQPNDGNFTVVCMLQDLFGAKIILNSLNDDILERRCCPD